MGIRARGLAGADTAGRQLPLADNGREDEESPLPPDASFADQGYLDAELLRKPVPDRPFGSGPWRCENPLSDHFHQQVVTKCEIEQKNLARGFRGHFHCSCGYHYTRVSKADGTITAPHRRAWGPPAIAYLEECAVHGVKPADAAALDARVALALPAAALSVLAIIPPIRVTAKRLSLRLNESLPLIVNNLHRLPRTAKLRSELIEDREAWNARRAFYLCSVLDAEWANLSMKERYRMLALPGVRALRAAQRDKLAREQSIVTPWASQATVGPLTSIPAGKLC